MREEGKEKHEKKKINRKYENRDKKNEMRD